MPPASPPSRCANCDAQRTGEFCAACGQRAAGRLRSREILGDVVSSVFGLESKLGRTVLGLTKSPGRVADEYVAGKRARYVSPFRYCLTVLAVFVFVTAMVGENPLDTVGVQVSFPAEARSATDEPSDGELAPLEVGPGDAAELDPSAETDRERQVRIVNRIRGFLSRRLMTLLMLALPVLGVTLRLLFRRSGRNYAETMAFVFYAVGHAYLVGSALSLLLVWWTSAGRPLRALSIVGYLVYGATVFFSGPRFVAVIKTLVAYAAYVTAVVVLAILAALPLILLELNR